MNEMTELLVKGAAEFGITLEDHQVDQFIKFKELLIEWNQKINLTAIEDDRDVIIKHFIDSLSILPFMKKPSARIIDVGTGAGFPGIPLKIADAGLEVTLLDSLDKRVKYLREVVDILDLKQIQALHGRAEDFGVHLQHREKYDFAVARAVASMPVLLEYCLPFVKVGGYFIAMKGSNTEEMNTSEKALKLLGGTIEKASEFTLPFSDIKRSIILVKKVGQTPTKYPRKAGKPTKEPLI